MSANTPALSGRALALARRKALTQGKGTPVSTVVVSQPAPVSKASSSRSVVNEVATSTRQSVKPIAPAAVMPSGRQAALERRKQQVKGSGSQQAKTQPVRQPRQKVEAIVQAEVPAAGRQTTAPVAQAPARSETSNRAKVKPSTASVPVTVMPKGRLVARAHRKAQAEGKAKLKSHSSQTSSIANIAKMANPEATGREIARQIRQQRCTQGKVCGGVSRPTGRTSKKSESNSPEKVGFAQTSYEQTVSGSLVASNTKMTGTESGSCRVISGTEYTGPDEYQAKCSFKPEPNVRKVALTATASGRVVSGTEVGLSKAVTGTESGQCRQVTGTEYLPADQGEMFCGTKPVAGVAKVSQSYTAKNQIVSGPSMQKRELMTGTEMGEQRQITGSQYVANSAPIGKKPTREMRASIMSGSIKCDISSTSAGNLVSGTNVNFNSPVTGENAGFCAEVTGNEYQSVEARAIRCGDSLPSAMKKSIESQTFNGQRITGDRAGLGGKITGASAGVCKSVTGSPYLSFDAVESCSVDNKAELKPDTKVFGSKSNVSLPATGVQPGPIGLTGAQRGVCQTVSGTPYMGSDQVSAMCQVSAPANIGDSDYPVIMNQIAPMVASGIPMYNYGYVPPLQQPQNILVGSEGLNEADKVVSKITGDGADSGHTITGDSWGRSGKVSGTEGRWSKDRNVSIPGGRSSMNAGASSFRPKENPKVSDSPITGSSGNTKSGALVTVSGGARA